MPHVARSPVNVLARLGRLTLRGGPVWSSVVLKGRVLQPVLDV